MKYSLPFLGLVATASATQFAPPAGQTLFNLGQNYIDEWNDFASKIKTPAGISVYGDIYSGALNGDSQTLLKQYAGAQSGGIVEVGMSWKDAMTLNGYNQYQGALLCDDIANGKFDQQLRALATYLKGFPNMKYLLRVDYEVTGNLHANTNPNGWDESTWDKTAYPKAFAHVRQLFLGVLPNVDFVYHATRSQATVLYPGDDVVDWNGFSIFNNDVCLPDGTIVGCSSGVVDPNLLGDIQWAPKPKLVAESAVQPPSSSDSNGFANYLTLVKNIVEEHDFAAWTYINSDWTQHDWPADTWGDSRIETNPAANSWFNQNIESNPRYVFG